MSGFTGVIWTGIIQDKTRRKSGEVMGGAEGGNRGTCFTPSSKTTARNGAWNGGGGGAETGGWRKQSLHAKFEGRQHRSRRMSAGRGIGNQGKSQAKKLEDVKNGAGEGGGRMIGNRGNNVQLITKNS